VKEWLATYEKGNYEHIKAPNYEMVRKEAKKREEANNKLIMIDEVMTFKGRK